MVLNVCMPLATVSVDEETLLSSNQAHMKRYAWYCKFVSREAANSFDHTCACPCGLCYKCVCLCVGVLRFLRWLERTSTEKEAFGCHLVLGKAKLRDREHKQSLPPQDVHPSTEIRNLLDKKLGAKLSKLIICCLRNFRG